MTNWQKFKITEKSYLTRENLDKEFIVFVLDNTFFYKGGEVGIFINCTKSYPFDTWKAGDYLEINLDRIKYEKKYEIFNDIGIVRKVDSSAVVPSSSSNQQLTSNQIQQRDERMRRWVEESGGVYEADFIAREEYRTDGSVNAREMKWTYRKK